MKIEKKKFDSTNVDQWQVINESGIVLFEGDQDECEQFVFANI